VAHAFLHVSWTEGVPQVLFEAFAARLPVVATDVGGVGAVAGDAAILIQPGDPDAAAEALERIAEDVDLRRRLTDAGVAQASKHNFEAEAARTAEFLVVVNADAR
jgi:glycosyltransferase involved in cell wall biosynthesis